MKFYAKILVPENNRRIVKLHEFRNIVINYFNNSHSEFCDDVRTEKKEAQQSRIQINRNMDEIHDIILSSGINPSIQYTPPPAVGGYIKNIDLIKNIFYINSFDIDPNFILDFIDRSIGIYESNHTSALIRTFNPIFYIGLIFDYISELPFIAISKFGFNRQKAESSFTGKFIKGILYLITVIAAFLTILQLLDLLEPVKILIHEIIGSNKTLEGRTSVQSKILSFKVSIG